MVINVLVTNRLTDNQIYLGLMHAQFLIGLQNIIYHMKHCYNAPIATRCGVNRLVTVIKNLDKRLRKCPIDNKIDVPLLIEDEYLKYNMQDVSSVTNNKMVYRNEGVYSSMTNVRTVRTTNIRKNVPSAGRVVVYKIMSSDRRNKMTRVIEIEQFLLRRPTIDHIIVNVKNENVIKDIESIKSFIKSKPNDNRAIVLVTYDKWPSLVKQTEWYKENSMIEVKHNTIIYIPDDLAYNVMYRHFVSVTDGNTIPEIEKVDIQEATEVKEAIKTSFKQSYDIHLICIIIIILLMTMMTNIGVLMLQLLVILMAAVKYRIQIMKYLKKKILGKHKRKRD
jgi:hypothetical protein